MTIDVVQGGLFTTIQDRGRVGFEAYGIPQNGFLDIESATLANHLVGNNKNEALLEITGTGPILKFDEDCIIAITGANMSPSINNRFVPSKKLLYINAGDQLSFGKLKSGYRSYLAIGGKLMIEEIYGSKSTNTIAGFGGLNGNPLTKGDIINVKKCLHSTNRSVQKSNVSTRVQRMVLITKGPEFDWFSAKEVSRFMRHLFTISNQSNRMGCQLQGNWLEGKELKTIISSGNIPGVIQITPDLQPIILLNDAGTTGGYPRIALCTQRGINTLAQCKPGDSIGFSF